MFTCNNINLLTFTYYLKLFLAICMTIIPFLLSEKIVIHFLKLKEKNIKITKKVLRKEFKSVFYILVIFILSFTLHTTLNNDNNICYMYAKSDIINEYKIVYSSLEKQNLDKETKMIRLQNVLLQNTKPIKKTNLVNNNTSNKVMQLNNNINSSKNTNNNFLKETDNNKLNQIYVIDGVFYYPNYINGNRNTFSGTSCPSNPLNEGYNNPYGYNNYFYTRLTKFIEDAGKNGYKITLSTQGCRTYDTQVYYYNTMTPGRAAYPGKSLHGFGIASDLEFYKSDGSVCPYGRNASNCPSMGWAHQNAYKYGLTFPLLNASYKEDWHIEPINKVKY